MTPMVYLHLELAELGNCVCADHWDFIPVFFTLTCTYNEFTKFSEFYKSNDA